MTSVPTVSETIAKIVDAKTWDKRIAEIRLIPQYHGLSEQHQIQAAIARLLYVPSLAPDFAYINEAEFYGQEYFDLVYGIASVATNGFMNISEESLTEILQKDPRTLLVFRTITGLTKAEFSHASKIVASADGRDPLTSAKVDSMERSGTATTTNQAGVAAITLSRIVDQTLFGMPPAGLVSKLSKADTKDGWTSVQQYAKRGVPFSMLLHQRHYGGAFRQLLDATSTTRGNLIEDAVESLFKEKGVLYIRTGSNNQSAVAARFQIQVTPAPDFVVFDKLGVLRAILECKGTNDGGTARDKAHRFDTLRREAIRLGGVPLVAVLGGIGWSRVNDALGPVVRDTDGRVFTLSNLSNMLLVQPFPSLIDQQR